MRSPFVLFSFPIPHCRIEDASKVLGEEKLNVLCLPCNLIVVKNSVLSVSQLKFRLNFFPSACDLLLRKKSWAEEIKSGMMRKVCPHISVQKRKMMNRDHPNLTRKRPTLRAEMLECNFNVALRPRELVQ